jgi:hypothetical protein
LTNDFKIYFKGENVLVISPDSDNLSVLLAAVQDSNPDQMLPQHGQLSFQNGLNYSGLQFKHASIVNLLDSQPITEAKEI